MDQLFIWQMNSETNNSETNNQPVIFHGDTLVYIYIYGIVSSRIIWEVNTAIIMLINILLFDAYGKKKSSCHG